jgi:hypothetical protein
MIFQNYPLASGVSYSWFGIATTNQNTLWTRTPPASYTGNSACHWSWIGLSIPDHGVVTRGVIIRSGQIDVIQPYLTLVGARSNVSLYPFDSLGISCSISNAIESRLLLVVDRDLTHIILLCQGITSTYSGTVNLTAHGIGIGMRHLSFYAVDEYYGRVSEEQYIALTVLDPGSLVPISWGAGSDVGFDIHGTDSNGSRIETTGGRGYAVKMRIGSDVSLSSAFNVPLTHHNVDLVTDFTPIGEYAVLITFRLYNGNEDLMKVDVTCDGDLSVDGMENAVC